MLNFLSGFFELMKTNLVVFCIPPHPSLITQEPRVSTDRWCKDHTPACSFSAVFVTVDAELAPQIWDSEMYCE
jgi:hypothetical protein